MKTCRRCDRENPDWAQFCVGCGARIGETQPDAQLHAERGHIDYLLTQIPGWQMRALVSPSSAGHLTREYMGRRAAIDHELSAPTVTSADAGMSPVAAPPIVQSYATPGQAPPPVPSAPAQVPPSPPAGPPIPFTGPWWGEFLQEHWLKLLASVAALFIFAGMRQVLGWEWVSQLVIMAIPVLPTGLTIGLFTVGMRVRDASRIASFSYGAVGTVLATFAVGSINKHWLDGAIPQTWTYAIGFGASTALAWSALNLSRDVNYLHLGMGGASLTVFQVMWTLSWGEAPPVPRWAIAAALLVLAAAYGVWGRQVGEDEVGDGAGARRAAVLWTHLTATGALWAALGCTTPMGDVTTDTLALFIAGTLLYGALAQWYASEATAYATGILALTSGGMLLHVQGWEGWYPYGTFFLLLALVAAALAAANRQPDETPTEPGPMCRAYSIMCAVYGSLAGMCIAGRLVAAQEPGASLIGRDWAQGIGLALACAAAYVLAAIAVRRPAILYSAAAALTFGVTLAAYRPIIQQASTATALASSLLPAMALMLPIGLALRRRRAADVPAATWGDPLIQSAAVVGVSAFAVGIGARLTDGASPWIWSMLAATGAAGITAAVWAWRDENGSIAQSGATAALAAAAASTVFRVMDAHLAHPWTGSIAAGTSAAAFGAVAATAVALLSRSGALGRLHDPLRIVSAVTTVLGCSVLVVEAGVGADEVRRVASVVMLALGVWLAACTAATPQMSSLPLALSAIAAALGGFYAWLADPTPATNALLPAAGAACAVLWQMSGRQSGRSTDRYAAAIAISLAWFSAISRTTQIDTWWWALAQLPLWIALAAYGIRGSESDVESGRPARTVATIGALATAAALLVAALDGTVPSPWLISGTLAAYGAAFAAGAAARRTSAWTLAAAIVLIAAPAYHLGALSLGPSEWAAAFAAICLLWLGAGALLSKGANASLAIPVYGVGGVGVGAAAMVALACATMPGQGEFSVLTMAISGSFAVGLFVLTREQVLMHAGMAAYFLGYCMFLYDRANIGAGNLDLYLIPVGLYLMAVGHFAAKRGVVDQAQALWWSGSLSALSPTFVAFYTHYVERGAPWHALLLVVECAAFAAWGIMHRIKAFVFSGTLFALAFAAVLGAGAVMELWAGLIALGLGLAILGTVFYLSTRRAELQRWIAAAAIEWQRWR